MNKKILDKIFHCIVVGVMILMIGVIPIVLTIAETIRLYFLYI